MRRLNQALVICLKWFCQENYVLHRYDLYGPANDPGPQMIPVPQMIPKLDSKWSQDRKWFLQMVSQKIENGVDSMNSPWMYIFFNCVKWRRFNYERW